VAESLAACGYLVACARAPWAAQRAAAAALALAAAPALPPGGDEATEERHALACFRLWEALCAWAPPEGVPEPAGAVAEAAASALSGSGPERGRVGVGATEWCAAALGLGGALLGVSRRAAAAPLPPDGGAAQARDALLRALLHAAAVAAAESDAAPRCAAAARRARAVSCAAVRLRQQQPSTSLVHDVSCCPDVALCAAAALLRSGGAALGPLQALAAAASAGAPPGAAAAAARARLAAPPASEAGAHARLLCDALSAPDDGAAAAAAAAPPWLRRRLVDEACAACAAASDAYTAYQAAAAAAAAAQAHASAQRAQQQPHAHPQQLRADADAAAAALRAACELAFLCPVMLLAAACPPALLACDAADAMLGADVAGRVLGALARIEFARPAAPPPRLPELLEACARGLGARPAAAMALADALPREDAELASPRWHEDDALAARCHLLLRALPFGLRALEDASDGGGGMSPAMHPHPAPVFVCDAPPPHGPLFDAVAPLALACVGHPAARVAEAAHALLQAALRGTHPQRAALIPAYFSAALAAFPGPGAPSAAPLAASLAAALRALHAGDPLALTLLRRVAERAAQLPDDAPMPPPPGQQLLSAAPPQSPAAAVRSVLYRGVLYVAQAQLGSACVIVEGAVARLRRGAARQAALDELCALAGAGTDHYRKRYVVGWCLRLAQTLSCAP
jgi:hypothetical protein